MEYYSAIKMNTFESVLMRWMKLEPIIQSEVSQKKKILEFGKAEMFGICKAQYSERRKLQRRSCRNLH